MIITLKNGNKMEVENGKKLSEIAKEISEGLAREAVVAKVNGELKDLSEELNADAEVEFFTLKDKEGLDVYRHTCSHILAQAVKNIFPTCALAIGPTIENGFYYDFDFKTPISQDDFEKIEEEMKKIIKSDLPITRYTLPRNEAIKLMKDYNEPYKVQLIEDLPEGEEISFYKQGAFTDLCKGPHLSSTGKIKAFKLMSLTGAYWRGSEKNKMLTRIYATAFEKKSQLEEYVKQQEEAKRRDHNKLGRELGYFMTSDVVGQGLPLFGAKGSKVMQTMIRFVEDEEERRGFMPTRTPSMAKSDLYKISGHWDHYRDKMFVIGDADAEGEVLAMRPMTCPFQYQIYKNGLKSYKDLPYRFCETATEFRNENSGEMHGLIRVRQFTLSDGHIICAPEQVESEFKRCLELSNYFLKCLGMENDVTYRFSKRGKNKAKYIDNDKAWEDTQNLMRQILNHLGLTYVEADDEAAFYGPKLDVQCKNVYGKEDTLITIQLDFSAGTAFDMSYIDQNGEKKTPFVIHRSSIGCYERVFAMLIEKYAGAFPTWLCPVQVKILPVTDRAAEYAEAVKEALYDRGLRAEVDSRSEKIGKKIRDAQMEKVPYMLVIGDKEVEAGDIVAVRSRRTGDMGEMKTKDFIEMVHKEDKDKVVYKD